ncbi:MAG: hypothetical protein WA323_18830 [Candidatus Nitrosopolaris sp.]
MYKHTNQKQQCDTAGGSSGIGGFRGGFGLGPCSARSTDGVNQTGATKSLKPSTYTYHPYFFTISSSQESRFLYPNAK